MDGKSDSPSATLLLASVSSPVRPPLIWKKEVGEEGGWVGGGMRGVTDVWACGRR